MLVKLMPLVESPMSGLCGAAELIGEDELPAMFLLSFMIFCALVFYKIMDKICDQKWRENIWEGAIVC